MKNNKNVVYGQKLKKSDIFISILLIWAFTFLFLKLVFMYAKTSGYVDGWMNDAFFEPILALFLTPILALLFLNITTLEYLEFNQEGIIYYQGKSLSEYLKLVRDVLKDNVYETAYKNVSYPKIKKLLITYNAGNPSSKSNFDTYYLSLKFFDEKECFINSTQSMVLNDELNTKLIYKIIEEAKNHAVKIDDPYQIFPLLQGNQKTLYDYLNNTR